MSKPAPFDALCNEYFGSKESTDMFASGEGEIRLEPYMTDDMLLLLLKYAIEAANGAAFTVITTDAPKLEFNT